MKDRFVKLGFCGRPHGIKGGFSFSMEAGSDTILTKGMKILLVKRGEGVDSGQEYNISKISGAPKTIVYLDGINDRNRVEELIPFEIYISRDVFPEPDDDEVYLNDLIGLKVYDFATDIHLGVVDSVYDHGAHPIVSIKMKDGELVDLPFIEHFVPEIDFDNGLIKILQPEMIG